MGRNFADLKRDVIDPGLCTRCGTCVGVCKISCIEMGDPLGICLPVQIEKCISCGLCYTGCPGGAFSWPDTNKLIHGKNPDNYLLGNFINVSVGFSNEPIIRNGAGSGGIVSAISIYLLENKLVDGVISLNDDPQQPFRAIPQILRNRKDVLSAAQSKYSISPVNTIFHQLTDLSGSYAYVGLPCQIHALRKLQQYRYPATNKIKFVIGLYCGNILHFDSVRSFLKRNGVSDLQMVSSLKYRAGEWPGKMEIKLKDGREFSLLKFYANYLIPFYIMRRCLLCTDLTNEFADVAVGDGWAPAYEERGKGWSVVLGRTATGVELLTKMEERKVISLFPISEDDAVNMHSHGLDLKKYGAFLRIKFRKWRRLPVPEYGYELINAPLSRYFREIFQEIIFRICSWQLSRWVVNLIPLKLLGETFLTARKVWMRSTKSTHKYRIANTKYQEK